MKTSVDGILKQEYNRNQHTVKSVLSANLSPFIGSIFPKAISSAFLSSIFLQLLLRKMFSKNKTLCFQVFKILKNRISFNWKTDT